MRALVLSLVVACGDTAAPPPAMPLPTASTTAAPRVDPWTSAALARSNATGALPTHAFELIVSKTAITLADGTRVVPVPADDAAHGVDATYKRRGPNDLYIEPLGAIFRAQSARDAILAVDPAVSYRLLVEVLFTLGQNELGAIHLRVRSATGGVASIVPTLPRVDTSKPPSSMTLGLAVLVVRDGISVKARGGNVAPGCEDVGPGLAIPSKDGAPDTVALATCATRLKNLNPDYASETSVTIAANPATDFQTLVTVMDALRPMFPSVTFGIPK